MNQTLDYEKQADYSEDIYRYYSHRYSEVSHQLLQWIYVRSSHPALNGDFDLLERLIELSPGFRGLDAGCGAGARDVHHLWRGGYDIYGIDAVEENIQQAKEVHPEIADRVAVADLRYPLAYPGSSFDFVLCNAVIQHIASEYMGEVTLPELARVLRPAGVLQFMFKNGHDVTTVYDVDYGVERSFHLYEEHQLLGALKSFGLELRRGRRSQRAGWGDVFHRSQTFGSLRLLCPKNRVGRCLPPDSLCQAFPLGSPVPKNAKEN